MEVLDTIPILRIFDLPKAKEFYVGFLGFKIDWEHIFEPKTPIYMQISRGKCVIHLSEHHGDCCPGSTVFIRVTGLANFHKEINAKEYPYMRPGIEMAPWNAIMVTVTDPFGNRLRFNEDLKKSVVGNASVN